MLRSKCRSQLHAELNKCYKEYLESKLALALLNRPALLPAAHKVSLILLDLLQNNKFKIVDSILDECVLRELYGSDYFGRLRDITSPNALSKISVYDDIVQTLKNPQAAFECVMQVHCVVLYRILPKILNLPKVIDKKNECTRNSKAGACVRSDAWGINHNKCFSSMFKTKTLQHLRALEKFEPNMQSSYVKYINDARIPYVAGPSGHTRSVMAAAVSLGLTDTEALKQYALSCFAFLAAGGNHCFHEVMVAAKEYGVPYEDGDYVSVLPESVKTCSEFETLLEEFQDATQCCQPSVA